MEVAVQYGKEIEELITDENSLKAILERMKDLYKKKIEVSDLDIDIIES